MADIDKELTEYLAKASKSRQIYERSSEAESQKVPVALIRKAKDLMNLSRQFVCPHCGKAITPFKKPISKQFLWNGVWLGGAVITFMLSFLFRRFFLQFLVVALLFGVKWIVDQKAMRTQVLIYKALKESDREHLVTARH